MSKIIYPAAERNKPFILEVLRAHFDANRTGTVLEIASGTGQHVAYFARHFPNLEFQPSEVDGGLLKSIRAHAEGAPAKNVRPPLAIDVTTDSRAWGLHVDKFDYLVCINLMHISPFGCTEGLFGNAGRLLKSNGLMVTYGPYAYRGVIEPQSNVDFDRGLRSQNPEWGLRDIEDLKVIAERAGLKLLRVHSLPANNKCLVWIKM